MKTDNVTLDQEAKDQLIAGVNLVCDAVKLTLGAKGGNAILERAEYPYHIVTNDGISIARDIVSQNPVENMGVNIMKEVADRSNKESGDGTTTSMVLTQAILREGQKYENVSPMDIKRSLDACLPHIYQSLDLHTHQITPDTVGQVATISAEDPEMGAMLQEIYRQIGKDGIVELDNSGTYETSYKIMEGVRLRNAGYLAPYMANEGNKAVLLNPTILITTQKIAKVGDIDPLIKTLKMKGDSELVIFCHDIEPTVASALAQTHLEGIFRTVVIKAPTLWKDLITEDFAHITGAQIVDPLAGKTLKNLDMSWLGTCDKLIVGKEETTVIGIADISKHLEELKNENSENSKLRLAWLQTKAAVVYLGANSESELSYRRLKLEDARNASYLALQHGIVAGGGSALAEAVKDLPEGVGGDILREALKAPAQQIAANAGHPDLAITYDYHDGFGFDVIREDFVNMFEAGIVDPAVVTRNAITNAISIAGTVLTAQVAVTQPKA